MLPVPNCEDRLYSIMYVQMVLVFRLSGRSCPDVGGPLVFNIYVQMILVFQQSSSSCPDI